VKIALITTTIRVPRNLELFRAYGPDVDMVIAGDKKTPHGEVAALADRLGALYLSDGDQERLGYACSEVIGWNVTVRRNVALLEALKLKPDIVITVDDDNWPLETSYFEDVVRVLAEPYTGLVLTGVGWVNVGALYDPPYRRRGFPPTRMALHDVGCAVDWRVGVAQGLCLGDPDAAAQERLDGSCRVTNLPDLLRRGVVVEPGDFAPFNSQNTAYRAELAPLMAMLPGSVGRNEDSWASYLAQRIMWELGYCIHYGTPLVWQQRNKHDPVEDYLAETFADEMATIFCRDLRAVDLSGAGGDMLTMLLAVHQQLSEVSYLQSKTLAFFDAWIRDLEVVL
jgi:hypothetical protein